MKRSLLTSVVSMIMVFFVSYNSFAMPYNPNDYTSVNEVSALLPPGIKQSEATDGTKTRGDFFIRADLFIRDNEDGTVGATAVALARYSVDEAYITVYLDRWDETTERWRQVNSYEAEFYAKDYPDGLTTPSVDLTFKNVEKGYYYRLRAVFGVVYQNEFEGFSPVTDGILIE